MVGELNEAEKERVMQAIARAEVGTSGEIMVVVAKESGDWRAASLSVSIAFSVLAALLIGEFTPIRGYAFLCLIQLTLMVGLDFFLQESGLVMHLVPERLKIHAASRNAKAQFMHYGLHTTRTRAAIMLFVSRRERYVEILADVGVGAREDATRWENMASEFRQRARTQSVGDALVAAIDECGALLRTHFPIPAGAPPDNELPDRLRPAL